MPTLFESQIYRIDAESTGIQRPITGTTFRLFACRQPVRVKLVRPGLSEEFDMWPGMARTFGALPGQPPALNEPGFMGVEIARHRDFRTLEHLAEPLEMTIGYGTGQFQDNRAVADIVATVAAPAMSVPAPVQWRIVPKIGYETVDGRHKWTEQPGVEPEYDLADAFTEDGHKCICIALANPRVIRRRLTYLGEGGAKVSPSPLVFDGAGDVSILLSRVLDSSRVEEIDGGGAIFRNATNDTADVIVVEEWFTPETITLPPNLSSWPDNLAPALWLKNHP